MQENTFEGMSSSDDDEEEEQQPTGKRKGGAAAAKEEKKGKKRRKVSRSGGHICRNTHFQPLPSQLCALVSQVVKSPMLIAIHSKHGGSVYAADTCLCCWVAGGGGGGGGC
jgi:hypothetical protein